MSHRAVVLAALFAALPQHLCGQHSTPLAAGDRARVTARQGATAQHFVGRVSEVGRDTILLDLEGDGSRATIPRSTIEKVEISRGRHGNVGKGALIGLGIGTIGGGILGAVDASHCDTDTSFCLFSPGGEMAVSAFVFGVLGTAGGAVIGAFTRSDRWETVAPGQ